jgi:hypothetical protein
LGNIKRYIDNEYIEQHAADLDVWYYFYESRITCLICNRHDKRVAGLLTIEQKDVIELSLSQLKDALSQIGLPELSSEQIHPVIVDSRYTIVPEPLYVGEKAEIMFKLVHPFLYATSELFYRTLRVVFPGSEIHHYATDLFKYIEQFGNNPANRLYVHLHATYFDVINYQKQNLTYHNTFPYEADTDIIYFLLSLCENLHIPSEKIEVVLSGDFNSNHALTGLMKKYIPTVTIMQRNEEWTYAASMRELQEQQYFMELTGLLCASFQAH